MNDVTAVQRAIQIILDNPDEGDFVGPQTEELIHHAEETLELRFPQSYRCFLSQLGCGDFRGEEYYGVFRDDFENSGIPDAVWITMKKRKSSNLPRNLVIVNSTGDGGYLALETNDENPDNAPVIYWYPAKSQDRVVAFDGFGKLLTYDVGIATDLH